MDDNCSLALVLLDFVPVFAFLVGGYYLFKLTFLLRGRLCGWVVMKGALFVFLSGLLKAVWKLICTTGLMDIRWMGEAQFVLAAAGFLAILWMVIVVARGRSINMEESINSIGQIGFAMDTYVLYRDFRVKGGC